MQQHDLQKTGRFDETALETSERARARGLLELLTESGSNIRVGVAPELLDSEQRLQHLIESKSNYRLRLIGEQDFAEKAMTAKSELDELWAQYHEVEGQIRKSSPGYAALTQPQPLGLHEIQQQLLDSKTVLLEYALGEKRSYVFVVAPGSLDSYELPQRSEIEKEAHRVYDILTSRNRWIEGETSTQREARVRKDEANYQEAITALSQKILGPVAAHLEGKRLLIVADGALQYIPFAALPIPGSDAMKPSVPLIAEHEIVNLPSASVLALLRWQTNSRTPGSKEVAVFADPVFDKYDPRVSRAKQPVKKDLASEQTPVASKPYQLTRSLGDVRGGTRAVGSGLPRLVFSRQEANAIMAVTDQDKGLMALDFQASRDLAMSKEIDQYRIVHFATHGLLDNEHPELSGLVLSLVDSQGKPQNGFLDLQDVFNMDLPVDLVVLSACETGLGKEISGEGLVGLTRGFMYAGAPRVVASLWKVDDAATADLMGLFYKAMLKDGIRPAAALRQAQLEMWKDNRWKDPYNWAAFTIQGEWR
jgi:CHAT domain-containing protein